MMIQTISLKFIGMKIHISYKIPKVLAFKRPTWEVNPTRKIDDFKLAFYTDLGRCHDAFCLYAYIFI
jgi:hypothetical protein